jgi:hypothetical protein
MVVVGQPAKLTAGESIKIDPGGTWNVPGVLQWELPADAPPMVAVVRVVLVLEHGAVEQVRTPPHTFLLASRMGDLNDVINAALADRVHALAIVAALQSFEGKWSDIVTELLRRAELAAGPPAS